MTPPFAPCTFPVKSILLLFCLVLVTSPAQARLVEFRFPSAAADRVLLRGSFDNWKKDWPMERGSDGVWRLEKNLTPGRDYHYKFLVDGLFMLDPENPETANDGQGWRNSVMRLVPAGPDEPVVLEYSDAAATSVSATGDFNGWASLPLRPVGGGLWRGETRMPRGVHRFVFVTQDGAEHVSDRHDTDPLIAAPGRNVLVHEPQTGSQPARRAFRVDADQAYRIEIAGTFNKWRPVALKDPDGDGVWEIALSLPPGVHFYKIVLDGVEWLADPGAEGYLFDDKGNLNGYFVEGKDAKTETAASGDAVVRFFSRLARAHALYRLGRINAAGEEYLLALADGRAIEESGRDHFADPARVGMAAIAFDRGLVSSAMRHLEGASEADAIRDYVEGARSFDESTNPDSAVTAFLPFGRDNRSLEAGRWFRHGLAVRIKGDYIEAQSCFESTLRLAPFHALARYFFDHPVAISSSGGPGKLTHIGQSLDFIGRDFLFDRLLAKRPDREITLTHELHAIKCVIHAEGANAQSRGDVGFRIQGGRRVEDLIARLAEPQPARRNFPGGRLAISTDKIHAIDKTGLGSFLIVNPDSRAYSNCRVRFEIPGVTAQPEEDFIERVLPFAEIRVPLKPEMTRAPASGDVGLLTVTWEIDGRTEKEERSIPVR